MLSFHSGRGVATAVSAIALSGVLTLGSLNSASAATLGWNADALSRSFAIAGKLPAAPAGVTDLAFGELFRAPVGPLGLEFTDKARQLDGQRVRVLGFMVHQDQAASGKMILAPFALTTDEAEYGLCDDLPAGVISVTAPKFSDRTVPFTPGPLVLIGRLELGPTTESDGRVFHIRLILDNEDASSSATVATQNP